MLQGHWWFPLQDRSAAKQSSRLLCEIRSQRQHALHQQTCSPLPFKGADWFSFEALALGPSTQGPKIFFSPKDHQEFTRRMCVLQNDVTFRRSKPPHPLYPFYPILVLFFFLILFIFVLFDLRSLINLQWVDLNKCVLNCLIGFPFPVLNWLGSISMINNNR